MERIREIEKVGRVGEDIKLSESHKIRRIKKQRKMNFQAVLYPVTKVKMHKTS